MRNVPTFSRQVEAEVLVERILVALEEALDERFVDDGDRRRRLVVGRRERAPAHQRHAEVLQVVRADAIPRRARAARRASAADGPATRISSPQLSVSGL